MNHSLPLQRYGAECLATFFLALSVVMTVRFGAADATSTMAALTLALFVYTIGSLSGAHLNPAVTLGQLSIKKISVQDAVSYILAQLVGAIVAMLLVNHYLIPGGQPVSTSLAEWDNLLAAEILGTFILAFGVATVSMGKIPAGASGAVVGGSLFLGVSIATIAGSAGVLNPAVALSLKILTTKTLFAVYILGPIIGSIAASQLANVLYKPMHHTHHAA